MPDELRIDEEFRALCPPHSDDESRLLRESIERDGIRDAVIAWQGTVLDGHFRVDIARRLGIAFPVMEIGLRDRDAAKLWILKNQLGRRNLSRIQTGYLRGRYYEMVKQTPGRLPSGESPFCTDGDKQVSDVVGKLFGVSRCTIMLDAQLSRAIDSMEQSARDCILSGKVLCYPSHVKQLSQIPFAEQRDIAARAESGDKRAIPDGLKNFAKRGGVAYTKCQCGNLFRVGSRCGSCAARSLASVSKAVASANTADNESNAMQSFVDEQESFAGWHERLQDLRKSGAGHDDLTFYSNYIAMWLDEHDEPTEFHLESLERLIDKCRAYLAQHADAVA